MILNEETRDIKHNFTNSTKFKIAQNAIAMQTLSSKIYSDPISSIIRELSSNAVDAHKEAGTLDKPYKVYLPTSPFNYKFSIRDYGTGMSHDQIMNIFTTYFESSKRDTNEYTGGFGLGCKTPFSYVSSFTIESFYQGIHRIYSAYKDEHDYPNITLTVEEATTEPNGLKIEFPIKYNDLYTFNRKAQQVYYWFDYKPEICSSCFDIESFQKNVPVFYESDHYIIFDDQSHDAFIEYHQSRLYIKQGNAHYNVSLNDNIIPYIKENKEAICQQYNIQDIEALINIMRSLFLSLKIPIGKIALAVSREHIHYNRFTIENILQEIISAISDIVKYILKTFQLNENIQLKRIKILQFINKIKNSTYSMTPIDFINKLLNYAKENDNSIYQDIEELIKDTDIDLAVLPPLKIILCRGNYKHNVGRFTNNQFHEDKTYQFIEIINFKFKDYFAPIVIDDLGNGGIGIINSQIKNLAKEHNSAVAFSFIKKADRTLEQYNKIIDLLPCHVIKTSDLIEEQDEEVDNTNQVVTTTTKQRRQHISGIYDRYLLTVPKDTDFTDSYYLYKLRNNFSFNQNMAYDFQYSTYQYLVNKYLKDIKIYSIIPSFNIKRYPDLKPLNQFMIDNQYAIDLYHKYSCLYIQRELYKYLDYIETLKLNSIQDIITIITSYRTNYSDFTYICSLMHTLTCGKNCEINRELDDVVTNINQDIIDKYPALYENTYIHNPRLKKLPYEEIRENYIKLINKEILGV